MRIIFAGTPDAAVPTLDALAASSHEIVGVVTRPPARAGRGRTLTPSPVAARAVELGLPLLETTRPNDAESLEVISAWDPDLGVIVAYGALLRAQLLGIPTDGWINLHFSDLPRWRGAAPVQHALLAQDKTIATAVIQLDSGLDTGPVYDRRVIEVPAGCSAGSLLGELAQLGASQVVDVADGIATGVAVALPQSETGATYASQLTKADAFIDFTGSAGQVAARVAAVTPNPGAWSTVPDGSKLKVGLVVAAEDAPSAEAGTIVATKREVLVVCDEGAVRLGKVAPAGKSWMDAADWWRGARLGTDARLGEKK